MNDETSHAKPIDLSQKVRCDELKALADQTFDRMSLFLREGNLAFLKENQTHFIMEALERVQQDAFNEGAQSQFNVHVSLAKKRLSKSQIEWPSEDECRAAAITEEGANRDDWSGCYYWLRDNVKVVPNEPISGPDLEKIAAEYSKRTAMGAEPFYQGWRACEKKLRANEPVNDGRSVCAHNNPDPMLCKECKGEVDEWTMDKRADQEAIF